MSELQTSKEDKFFGVSYQVGAPEKEEAPTPVTDEVELEIVDDTPKKPLKAADSVEESDEELSSYGKKVRDRINKLKYEQHEERRQREAAERMREEAIQFAQQLAQKNQQYESLIQRGESALVQQIKSKANIALEQAKTRYKEAYEQGDAEKIIAAQESLLNAQTEFREAERYERNLQSRPKPQPQETAVQQPVYQQPQAPRVTEKTIAWTQRNPWFGNPQHLKMTALAYATHEELVRFKGVQPESDEYFKEIDATMRSHFPTYFGEEDVQVTSAPSQKPPSTVVAPSNRSNGAKPRKIQLSATQVSLARRLGLTPEQYAKQLIKESSNG
jgi:hypothetical protein